MGSSSPKRGENKKYFKPPARLVDNTYGVLAVISLSQLDTESLQKKSRSEKKGLHGRNPGSMLTYGRRLGLLLLMEEILQHLGCKKTL